MGPAARQGATAAPLALAGPHDLGGSMGWRMARPVRDGRHIVPEQPGTLGRVRPGNPGRALSLRQLRCGDTVARIAAQWPPATRRQGSRNLMLSAAANGPPPSGRGCLMTFGPSRIITAVKSRLQTTVGKRFSRFLLVAAAAVVTSQLTLTICLGPVGLTAGKSAVTAWFTGAAVSYVRRGGPLGPRAGRTCSRRPCRLVWWPSARRSC